MLFKMENLQVEDIKRKYVLIDSNLLSKKTLSLQEDFSNGSPEISSIKPFTASNGWLYTFRKILDLKT